MQYVTSRLGDSSLVLYAGGTNTSSGALGTGLDLGNGLALATGTTGTPGDALVLGDVLLDTTAIDIASNDEVYTFRLFGSNDPTFATKWLLATHELGRAAVTGTNKRLGRCQIPFRNEALEDASTYPAAGGTHRTFRYIRLEITVSGTTPSWTGTAVVVPIVARN